MTSDVQNLHEPEIEDRKAVTFLVDGYDPEAIARLLHDAAKWITSNDADVDDMAFGLQDEFGYYWLTLYIRDWNDKKIN